MDWTTLAIVVGLALTHWMVYEIGKLAGWLVGWRERGRMDGWRL